MSCKNRRWVCITNEHSKPKTDVFLFSFFDCFLGSKWKCPFLEFWLCQWIWFNWIVSFDQLNESILVSCLCNSYIYICSKVTFISLDFLNEIHAICYLNDLHFRKKNNQLLEMEKCYYSFNNSYDLCVSTKYQLPQFVVVFIFFVSHWTQ